MTSMTTDAPHPLYDPRFRTSVAEADTHTLRYRGVSLDELVGHVPFGRVWGLLVDDDFSTRLPPAEMFPLPVRTGDIRVDLQSALAQLAPVWGFRPLHDIDDDEARTQLGRACVMALSFVAQSARGPDLPSVPQRVVDGSDDICERFLIRWHGEADPVHAAALDAYFVAAAEHGLNAATITARLIAGTGADVAACLSGAVGAISGPLHGGAPARVLHLLAAADRAGDPAAPVRRVLDSGRRLMGFGHAVYRSVDPRAAAVRDVCARLGAPRYELACAVEDAALAALSERHPDRLIATNLEFWAAVLLDFAEVPPTMFSALFACARSAGWSAHILEEKTQGRRMRPVATYDGPAARSIHDVPGWDEMMGR